MKTPSELRIIAKKRQNSLSSRLGIKAKLADVYEMMALEEGYKNWDTYIAAVNEHCDNDYNMVLDFFVEPLVHLKQCLLDDATFEDSKELLGVDLDDFRYMVKELNLRFVDSYVDFKISSVDFFYTPEYFAEALISAKPPLEGSCWRCRGVTKLLTLNVCKDLAKFGVVTEVQRISLCFHCAADYKNSLEGFQEYGGTSKRKWTVFEAALGTLSRQGKFTIKYYG